MAVKPKIKTMTCVTWERMHPAEFNKMQRVWRVQKVNGSIDYHPGQELLEPEMKKLIEAEDWSVTTVSP